jgi:hypothetical protein
MQPGGTADRSACAWKRNNRPVRRQMRTCHGTRAAGLRAPSRRALTGTSVLVARAESPTPVGESVGLAGASRSVRPGAAAQRLDGIGGRGCSLGGRCGRISRSARRRSALWRTGAAAAHVGAHVGAGTCYACTRHAGRRRSTQCPWVPKGARVRGYSVSTVSTAGTAGVRALQLSGARARSPLLRARVCAGVRVPPWLMRSRVPHATRTPTPRAALHGVCASAT